jgi:hypothetical protein
VEHKQTSPSMTVKLILFFVLRTKGHIMKTQLVKFLYLADLYAIKWLGQQITDLEWVYYHHGPWEDDIQAELERMDGKEINQCSLPGGAVLIQLGPNAPSEGKLELPESMKLMLDNIRREWAGSGRENLKNLLEYVYNTAPMKEVLNSDCSSKEQQPLALFKENKKLLQELAV